MLRNELVLFVPLFGAGYRWYIRVRRQHRAPYRILARTPNSDASAAVYDDDGFELVVGVAAAAELRYVRSSDLRR